MATNNRNTDPNLVSLYSTTAHVFQIDQQTRSTWINKAGDKGPAVPISLVTSTKNEDGEPSRRELKIVGTDLNGNLVLDAQITPRTNYIRRAQKFGQWTDQSGTVYGLGFESEIEQNKFVEAFHKLQREVLSNPMVSPGILHGGQQAERLTTTQEQQVNNISETTNGGRHQSGETFSGNNNTQTTWDRSQMVRQQQQQILHQNVNTDNNNLSLKNNGQPTDNNNVAGYTRSQSMSGMQASREQVSRSGRASPEMETSPTSRIDWQSREQLKYENERLKQALEESSKTNAKNAYVWQNELTNLRTNNAKLTQALQESKAHVQEWERELMNLRVENKELKLVVGTLESSNDSDRTDEYKKNLLDYKNYVDQYQTELRRKEAEIEELQRTMQDLEIRTQASKQNGQLDGPSLAGLQIQKLSVVNAKLEARIADLMSVQNELAQIVEKI